MRTNRLRFALLPVVILFLFATNSFSQKLAVKTNMPYLATATPNVELELGLAEKFTLGVSYGINPFTFNENKKWKHWLAQTELRYWTCERFYGHFFGLHVGASEYNVGRVKIPTINNAQDFRYEGWAAMSGISYGYSWVLGKRWNLEAMLGLGVMYTDYKKFSCPECGPLQDENSKTLFMPTKAAVSIIYMLK